MGVVRVVASIFYVQSTVWKQLLYFHFLCYQQLHTAPTITRSFASPSSGCCQRKQQQLHLRTFLDENQKKKEKKWGIAIATLEVHFLFLLNTYKTRGGKEPSVSSLLSSKSKLSGWTELNYHCRRTTNDSGSLKKRKTQHTHSLSHTHKKAQVVE